MPVNWEEYELANEADVQPAKKDSIPSYILPGYTPPPQTQPIAGPIDWSQFEPVEQELNLKEVAPPVDFRETGFPTAKGGPPLKLTEFRGPSQTIADALSEAYGIGTGDPGESLLGIRPEDIPTGQQITQTLGVPKAISVPSSAISKGAAGLGKFLTSVGGGVEVGTAALPGIGLLQKAKWVYDMTGGVGEMAGDLSVKLEKALKDPSSLSNEEWQSMAEDTANSALMLYGAGKISSGEIGKLTGIRAPLGRMLESDRTRFAKDLAEQLKAEIPTVETPKPEAIRQLGIPVPEGPFAQPGVRELADAALAEAMQLVKIPGKEAEALAALKRAVEPPQVLERPIAVAERTQGGGEAPYGKVSFQREAEAPLPERTQQAIMLEETKPQPSTIAPHEQPTVPELDIKPIEQRRIETYGERYIRELGPESARKRIEHLNKRTEEELAKRPIDSNAIRRLQQEAQNIANALDKPSTKGIITGRAIEAWADDVLRGGATHAGPDVLAAYMVKGAALIERGIINFAEWSAKMIAEHGPEVKPHLRALFSAAQETAKRTPIVESKQSGALKSARQVVEDRIASLTEGEEIRMRKSAARATESPAIPAPVQEKISTAPESFYKVQPNQLVEQAVKGMSDAELVSVPAGSNLFVAARLEAANRLFTSGNMEGGYQIFSELEKQGTSFGQNINQFKRLPGTLPEHTAFVINEKLKQSGKDPLTTDQAAKAIGLTKESKQADAALDAATETWRKNPTPENAKAAEGALLKANNSAIALQRFIGRFTPKSTTSVLKSILQGNLLTPISEVANIFGNLSFLPFRAMDRTIAAGLDVLDNALLGRKREVSVSPVGGTVSALSGLGKGASQIPEILFRGTGDTIKGEARAGLHPVEAWINQFSKNPEMPTTGGRLTLQDRINLALEGTFGVPAEVMLRGLGAGDAAFKEAAKARVITEQLRLHKVPKNQWAFARQFPELFFDRTVMEQIKGDTLAAVFQRNSKTIGHITNWIRGGGDVFDLAVATVAPYKLTPWNLIGEILSYNPVVAFSKALIEAKRGNTRAAKLNAGKYIVGGMLTAAGWWLYKNQLLAPSLDERSEAQKVRVLADQVLPPNHINISGLKRKLEGGDPAFKPGDTTVDIFKGGGLAGSIFYMTANIGRSFERQPEAESVDHIGALIRQSTLEQARFGMSQSFLSGVEGILTAVKDGNTDNYVRKYMNTVLSIPMPNSMATLSRATRENQPDFRAEGFTKQVENTVRNKLGFAGLDDYLPLKRGLWGEPLPQTPKGANALFYHFFDISKNRQVTDDPVPIELYKLWRSTSDTRAIPSLPDKTVTFGGTTYALTPEQRSAYSELVGKYRRRIVDSLVVNPNFYKVNDEVKLKLLDRAYGTGMDIGRAAFWNGFKNQLEPKAERAGFQQPKE